MEEEYYSQALADHGGKFVTDTNPHDWAFKALVIREDTVIASWTDEDGFDLVAYYGISAVTLLVTDPVLRVPGGKVTGELTLTSGSVFGIF